MGRKQEGAGEPCPACGAVVQNLNLHLSSKKAMTAGCAQKILAARQGHQRQGAAASGGARPAPSAPGGLRLKRRRPAQALEAGGWSTAGPMCSG